MNETRGDLIGLWQRRRALGTVFGLSLLGAWLLALPVMVVVLRSGVAHHPEADARLLEPGGLLLVELLRTSATSLEAARTQTELIALALMVLSPFALAAWCASAPGEPCTDRLSWSTRALHAYPTALGISAMVWLVRAVLLLAGTLVASALRSHLDGVDDRVPDLSAVVTFGCSMALVGLTPPLRDIAVVHALRGSAGIVASLWVGYSVLAEEWRPLLARQLLLYGALACFALLGLYAPRLFWFGSRSIGGSLAVVLGGPAVLAGCVVIRAACLDQARRSHRRSRRGRD